jgi:hypothetical protein
MFDTLRRLHPRGPSSRGVAVDVAGALLGPDCVLVRRTPQGFRCVAPGEARAIQAAALSCLADPDWLFEQCQRIAGSLAKGETALAQIYGLRIPIGELDDAVLARLRVLAPLLKAGFNPDEPRIPKGEPGAGQWTNGGENASTAETAVAEQDRKSICIEQCAHLLERPLPYRWSNLNTFAFHRCVNDCMRGAE